MTSTITVSELVYQERIKDADQYPASLPWPFITNLSITDKADEEWYAAIELADGCSFTSHKGNGYGEENLYDVSGSTIDYDEETEIVPGWNAERLYDGIVEIARQEL